MQTLLQVTSHESYSYVMSDDVWIALGCLVVMPGVKKTLFCFNFGLGLVNTSCTQTIVQLSEYPTNPCKLHFKSLPITILCDVGLDYVAGKCKAN